MNKMHPNQNRISPILHDLSTSLLWPFEFLWVVVILLFLLGISKPLPDKDLQPSRIMEPPLPIEWQLEIEQRQK